MASSLDASSSEHHARDVGKILLHAQDQLRIIRETLADPGSAASSARDDLQQVVEKVEAELRLKAEAVLNTVVQGSVNTLPTLGAYNFSSSQGLNTSAPPGGMAATASGLPRRKQPMPRSTHSAGAMRPDAVSRPAAASVAAERHSKLVRNPNSSQSRRHMAERFGIAEPVQHGPLRPIGRDKPGQLRKERVSKALGAPSASIRHDPQAIPPIGPRDVAAGLLSLVTRGLLPPNVDLTPAMERRPAPMVQAQSKMHDFKSQFAHTNSSAYVSPFGFDISNTKLDLISDVGVTLAEKREQEQEAATTEAAAMASIATIDIDELPRADEPPLPVKDARAREFDELMDTFSLHHFIIRHGVTLDSTPEYASYQRKYAANWGALQQLVTGLEELMARYSVPLAYVDGQKLAALALDVLSERSERALVDCLVNSDQVLACMAVPGQRFRASSTAEDAAATELQAAVRGKLARGNAAALAEQARAADVLTRRAKTAVAQQDAQRRLVEQEAEDQRRWEALTSKFVAEWPEIKSGPRVIIHIASFSGTLAQRKSTPNLDVRQNAQLPRLCDVKEAGVDVVYVAPFPLNEDVTHYFSKVLEIGGVADPHKRYKIVVPENHDRLPATMSLTSLLLHSPKALKKISMFAKGKPAYIVPGHIGAEERKLALALNMPLLAPEPSLAQNFGTKSGAKRIFAAGLVNTPPGVHDLYEELGLLLALAKLMCTHLDVPRWLFKLDDESGGRGIAHIDVASLESHQVLLQAHDADPAGWENESRQMMLQERCAEQLRSELPQRVVINMRWLWRSWRDFIQAFQRVGGVIEASPLQITSSPSVNLLVEPDGQLRITSVHEQIFSSPYTFVGAAFPQTAVPYPALREAGLAIGKACYEHGLIGHLGIDFVSFFDTEGQLRLWAVDLNPRLTHTAVTFGFFDFLVGGRFDVVSGRYAVSNEGGGGHLQQRSYVMNELFYHPGLPSMHHSAFFNLCRLKGVSFDLQEKAGTVFNLMDSFIGGVLGIVTVGTSLLDSLRKFADCLDFIQKQVGPANGGKATSLTHEVSFKDVIKAIKALVDSQVGEAKPQPQPPPMATSLPPREPPPSSAASEIMMPGLSGQQIRPLPPPSKRYLPGNH